VYKEMDDPYQLNKFNAVSILSTAKSSLRDKYVPIKRNLPPSRVSDRSNESKTKLLKMKIIETYRKEIQILQRNNYEFY
jgi:hypothetical protein